MEFIDVLAASPERLLALAVKELSADPKRRKEWAAFKAQHPEDAWERIAKRRIRSGDTAEWDEFVELHPEYRNRMPALKVTYGSPEDMTPGNCWKDVDQGRFVRNRSRRGRQKPSSDMTMPDGSPLRPSGEYLPVADVPPADFTEFGSVAVDEDGGLVGLPKTALNGLEDDADPLGREGLPVDPDELGSDVELFDEDGAERQDGPTMFDGIHGWVEERPARQDRVHGRMLEFCLLCASPLPLEWKTGPCEATGPTAVYYEKAPAPVVESREQRWARREAALQRRIADIPARLDGNPAPIAGRPVQGSVEGRVYGGLGVVSPELTVAGLYGEPVNACHCNGCLGMPKRSQGRMRLCSDVCRKRMDNAMDRANRKAAGKPSRPSAADPEADRIAQARIGLKVRAAQRKADESRIQTGVSLPAGVWVYRKPDTSTDWLLTGQGNVWQITGPEAELWCARRQIGRGVWRDAERVTASLLPSDVPSVTGW